MIIADSAAWPLTHAQLNHLQNPGIKGDRGEYGPKGEIGSKGELGSVLFTGQRSSVSSIDV